MAKLLRISLLMGDQPCGKHDIHAKYSAKHELGPPTKNTRPDEVEGEVVSIVSSFHGQRMYSVAITNGNIENRADDVNYN